MSDFDHFVGTRPVPASHALDVAALQSWLTTHLDGFAGPLSVEAFKGGQSNPTYKLNTPARSYVMRAKPGPVAWADRAFKGFGARGGFGIMFDDLVAAFCTLLVLSVWTAVFA